MNTMHSTPRSSAAALMLLIVLTIPLSGCAVLLGIEHPTIEGRLVEGQKRQTLVQRLAEGSRLPGTVKAMTRATVKRGKSSETFRYSLVFASPESIRVDVFPINSAFTLQRLTAANGKASLIDLSSKEALSGGTEETFRKSFLQVPATEQEVAALLLGRLPQRYLEDKRLEIYEGSTVITGLKGSGEMYWRMSADTLAMQEVQVRDKISGRLLVVATYGGLIACGAHQIPGHVEVKIPADRTTFVFTHHKPECGAPVRSDIFDLTIPRGYLIRDE